MFIKIAKLQQSKKSKRYIKFLQHKFRGDAFTKRSRPLARPRQIAMYLAKKLTQDLYQRLEENFPTEIIQLLYML